MRAYSKEFPVLRGSRSEADERVAEGHPFALDAYLGWAIHLHEEIHRYVRSYQVIFQLLATVLAAALATAAAKPGYTTAILIAAPYVLGVAIIQWTTSLREVMVNAAMLDEIEDAVRRETGRWMLFHETALSRYTVSRLSTVMNDLLFSVAFAVTVALSGVDGYRHLAERYWIVNVCSLAFLVLTVVMNAADSRLTRFRVRWAVRDLRSSVEPQDAA